MKANLTHISPSKLGLLLASLCLVVSIYGIIILFATTMEEGVSITLPGFFSYTFRNHIDYKVVHKLLLSYPVMNTGAGLVSGFVIAWIYNLWARFSGGLTIKLNETPQ